MVIHAHRRPASEQARRYNAQECFEIVAISLGVEDGELGTRDIVLRERRATNRNANHVLDKITIGRYSHSPLG